MNRLVLTCVFAHLLALPSISFAHGGTYRGPGDITPPSGGGGAGGGPPTPAPSGPGNPTPGGGRPTPGSGVPGMPGQPGQPSARTPGSGGDEKDLTGWEFWWGFNKDPYLALKAHLADVPLTGSEGYFLGRGEVAQGRDLMRVGEATIREKIVPRLLAALATERSNDIQSSCMIALAKIGEAKDEHGATPIADAIRPFLASSSQELAETAAVALGILASEENVPLLAAVLRDDAPAARGLGLDFRERFSMRTRAFAAYGLGLVGHRAAPEARPEIIALLRAMLDGEARAMGQRDVPVACLTALGLVALETTSDATVHGAPRAIPARLRTLDDQLAYLLAYVEDETVSHLTRAHAITALARLGNAANVRGNAPVREAVARTLIDMLNGKRPVQDALEQSAALALGMLGDGDEDALDVEIRRTLMGVKDSVADQQARNFSLIALAQASSRPGEGLGDPIAAVQSKDKRDNARAFLLAELALRRSARSSWAAIGLSVLERGLEDGGFGASLDSRTALATALGEAGSGTQRGALAIACGLSGATNARDELLRQLEAGGEVDARGYAAVGLGLLGDPAALPRIHDVLVKSKYQPELLKSSAIALGLLGDRGLVDSLVTMLGEATGLATQASISSALGYIGDSRSIEPLIGLLGDAEKTDLARAFAAVALGLIADKEELPWNSKISVGCNYRANTATLFDQRSGILDIL